ncbi:MAG: hypothetical protein H6807_15145 [Planctomycetes bacterium]|nr:hypothetical protein [Planctomycetota bacterium]
MTTSFKERLQADCDAFRREHESRKKREDARRAVLRCARVAASSDYDPWIVDGIEPSFKRTVADEVSLELGRDFHWILNSPSDVLASRIMDLAKAIRELMGEAPVVLPTSSGNGLGIRAGLELLELALDGGDLESLTAAVDAAREHLPDVKDHGESQGPTGICLAFQMVHRHFQIGDHLQNLHVAPNQSSGEADNLETELPENRFQANAVGDLWDVDFEGRTALVRDREGMREIKHLLISPEVSFSAPELLRAACKRELKIRCADHGEFDLESMGLDDLHTASDANEAEVLRCQQRIDKTKADLLEGGLDELELQELRERLEEENGNLKSAQRKVSRKRKKDGRKLKARIDRSIESIRAQHPSLGDHLDRSIKRKPSEFSYHQPKFIEDWT